MAGHTTFDALPANARVWVFASDRDMSDDEVTRLEAVGDRFLKFWKNKEEKIEGCYEIRERRFLIVGADESAAPLSGCSVDGMMNRLFKLEEETGLKLVDRARIYWRQADGSVASATRPEFRKLFEAGTVTEDTVVFDPTISRIEQLRENRLEVPLSDCWHAQLFAPQGA